MVASDRLLRWLLWTLVGNLVEGITAGIAVPIWAILLARSSRLRPAAEVAAT